jgi:hypothetical protein
MYHQFNVDQEMQSDPASVNKEIVLTFQQELEQLAMQLQKIETLDLPDISVKTDDLNRLIKAEESLSAQKTRLFELHSQFLSQLAEYNEFVDALSNLLLQSP